MLLVVPHEVMLAWLDHISCCILMCRHKAGMALTLEPAQSLYPESPLTWNCRGPMETASPGCNDYSVSSPEPQRLRAGYRVWATVVDHFGWSQKDAAKTCLLLLSIVNTCVLTVGVVYSVGIMAERPAGLDVWQILCALATMYVSQPVLRAGESGMRHLRRLKQLIIGNI